MFLRTLTSGLTNLTFLLRKGAKTGHTSRSVFLLSVLRTERESGVAIVDTESLMGGSMPALDVLAVMNMDPFR